MSQKKRPNFYESAEATTIKETLVAMQTNALYTTDPSYSANTDKYPDHIRSFVEKHMEYLHTHPSVDPNQYLANLRLITKVR